MAEKRGTEVEEEKRGVEEKHGREKKKHRMRRTQWEKHLKGGNPW